MSWVEVLPVAFATLACFFLPGILVGLAAGARGLGMLALAPALSLGLAGVGAVLLAFLGVQWTLWSYLGFTAAVTVAVFVLARVLTIYVGGGATAGVPRAAPIETPSRSWWRRVPRGIATLMGVVVAAIVSFTPLKEGMRWPDYPALTWDSIHHHSSVRYIIETGNGSSLNLGAVASNSKAPAFYPGAWHDLVSLTVGQLPISVSINVTALVMACVIWPLSVAYLARVAFPRLTWIPMLAPVIASGFVAFPARMISYGTVWPAAMGTAILPVILALLLLITSSRTTCAARIRLVLLLLIALAGATLCHPTATIAAAYLSVPFVVYRYVAGIQDLSRGGRKALVVALIAAPILAVLGVIAAVSTIPSVRSVFYFETTPVGPATDAVGAAVFDTMLAPLAHGNTEPFWVAGLLAIVGFILTIALREGRWVSISWMTTILLYVVAAGEQTVLRPLVGLWYSDPVRLGGLVPLFTSLLAAFAITRVVEAGIAAAAARTPLLARPQVAGAVALALVVALAAVLYPQTGELRADARSDRLAADYWRHLEWSDGIASLSELQMIERLGDELPEDAVVLGDPTSGAALVYALADRDVVFPTGTGAWDLDAEYLGRNFYRLDSDPRVCELIRKYRVSYFYDDDGRYLPEIIHRKNMGGLTAAGIPPGDLTLVDHSDDGAAVYKIESCGL
ncbi:DUF6541 family protein [Arthrobacter sp. B1805]|uniref:DUF6541 family protein n=1 Tax=Arthrobacter sp. B1805 TaxID=2058892 RepID=UPI000CE4DBB8|nr:DUF6541 family protein [Arthrobacter sp. B1805]